MKKVLMIISVFGLLCTGSAQASESPKFDLFDIKEGKAILEFENSATIQDEVKLWLQSITGLANRTTILGFQKGYCLRISLTPLQVKNKWIDASTQSVFLILDPSYEPVLLIFDTNWPGRYLVRFSYDVRPFLMKLGIWEMVKSSFPPAYGDTISSHY